MRVAAIVPCLLTMACGLVGLVAAETPEGWVVWSSARAGGINTVWRMKADGSGITQLVKTESDYPRFSPDGTWIAYNAGPDLRLMRPDGSDDKVLAAGYGLNHWFASGTSLCAILGDDDTDRSIWRIEVPSGKATKITDIQKGFARLAGIRASKLSISEDLRWITCMTTRFGKAGYTATNGRKRTSGGWAATILDLKNPTDLYYFGDGCQPMLPPWGPLAYHVNNGGGVISEMTVDDHSLKSHHGITARGEVGWGYCPSISTDNKWLAYIGCKDHGKWGSADYDVYLQPLDKPNDEKARTRLAQDPANDRWPHLYVGPLQVGVSAAPGAPKQLTATRGADGITCALTWSDASSNESGFAIELRADAGAEFTRVMVAPPGSTTFTLDYLDAAKKYAYRVRAVNLAGESDPTNQAGEIAVAEAPKSATPAKGETKKAAADGPDKLLAKADADSAAKRFVPAQKGYEQVIAQFPDSPEAATAKAKLEALKANPAAAKAAGQADRDANIRKWMSMARTYAGSGDKATARQYYQKVIDGYPEAPQAKEAQQALAALK